MAFSLRVFPILLKNSSRLLNENLCRKSILKNTLSETFVNSVRFRSSATGNKFSKKRWVVLGSGLSVAVLMGGYYYNQNRRSNVSKYSEAIDSRDIYFLKEVPPQQTVALKRENVLDKTGLHITLYQFQTCPFCCKVRAFLEYYGFSYEVIEVNPVTRKQIKWSSYRKVPFVIIKQHGKNEVFQLKDSSMIISILLSFLLNKNASLEELVNYYPAHEGISPNGKKELKISNKYNITFGEIPPKRTEDDILSEIHWRKWVDDKYVHVLSPNIYRTPGEAFDSFSWFAEVGKWYDLFSKWEIWVIEYVGAAAMYFIGKRLVKRHKLNEDVRSSFYEDTNTWLKELKQRKTLFLGGDEAPNLADLAVYGVLSAVEGCAAFKDLESNTKIKLWFSATKKAVQENKGSYLIKQMQESRS